ncbi:OmpH family outer membrane protein [Candidatus Pantoea carbekii]|uniref:Uncharacterized protein n=1 Tax=Candidatus Pantoea carbekii TaxID=1235990 RepID=U3U2P4_9GAMM|nr:OmpH family outer membrane protein [Candidatus Pantoea carbekii]AKC31895.1 periplasmic chaperone [Candidatus Pantoea carbekii]BAO00411.1 hypothetical protein HHS_04410 [Candidatus Pantoea carbekii]
MKKLLYAVAISFSLVFCVSIQAAEKIAVVNIYRVFKELPQSAIAAKDLENEFQGRSTELKNQEYELRKKIHKLQRDISILKPSERKRMEREIIMQREDFSNKAEAFDEDKHRRQTEERNKLLRRIRAAVKKVAESQGYDMVIDTDAIAYFSTKQEITSEVIKQVK